MWVAANEIDSSVQHMNTRKREIGVGPNILMPSSAREVVQREQEGELMDRNPLRVLDELAMEAEGRVRDDGVVGFGYLKEIAAFFVFAMQCLSTVAVVRRETQGWKWPMFQLAYMTGTGYLLAVAVYQFSRLFT